MYIFFGSLAFFVPLCIDGMYGAALQEEVVVDINKLLLKSSPLFSYDVSTFLRKRNNWLFTHTFFYLLSVTMNEKQ